MKRHDALIIGAGLAGVSAALWLRDLGLTSLLLEEALLPGGQLHEIRHPIVNYPAAFGWEGSRFAAQVLEDARRAGVTILVGAPITKISVAGRSAIREREGHAGRSVVRERERHAGRALLIATGLRRRSLRVPGERELLGRGVSHSANRDRTLYVGQPVVVVGGGTAAVEDAMLCAEVGCAVTLLHRSAQFRSRSDFLERARANPRIRMIRNARISRIRGADAVEGVDYRVPGSGVTRSIEARAVFVRIGWEPRTEAVRGQIRLDRGGYIRAAAGGATSARGVFAAGDVCSPRWPSIANAAGQGAAAAWEIARFLGRLKD